MAKSLLNGVNEVLKKVRALDSQGELSTLTDSARQMFIDTAVQSINEVIDELYLSAGFSKPKQLKESTITLAASTQVYGLNSDLLVLRREYNLIDETNNHVIEILGESGYHDIIIGDLEQDDTGQPNWAAIRPTDGRLYLDRVPTGTAIGRVYKYRYDREITLDDATDEMPFSDTVFRAVVPAASELWRFYNNQEFSQGLFDASVSRAAAALRRIPKRTSWNPNRGGSNVTDPMSNDETIPR